MNRKFFFFNLKRIILSLLLSLSFLSFGQERTFEHIKYGTREGLPSSEAYEILQDKRGNIWFSTDAGVSRFNGYEFENFNTDHGLTDNTVFHMYEDFKGRIWFLTYNSQLCYFDKGKIHSFKYNYKLKNIIPDQYIRSISIDSNENLTFVGNRFGIGSIQKNGTYNYQTTSKKSTGEIGFYQNGNDLLVYGLKSTNEENRTDLIDFKTGQETINIHPLRYGKKIDLFQISPGNFFINVDGVLGYKKEDEFKHRKLANEFSNLNKGYIDQKGRVWLAYHDGGIKIYKNIDEAYKGDHLIEQLFDGKNVSSIFEDNSGGIWLAVQNSGVYYIPNPNIKIHLFGKDELVNRVLSLYKTDREEIFAGTHNGSLFQLWDDRLPEHVFKENTSYLKSFRIEENKNRVKTLHLYHQVNIRNGITIQYENSDFKVKSEGYTIYENHDVRVNKVFEDSHGNVWVGTNGGLFMYQNGKLISMVSKSDLFKERIEDIDQLNDGTLLFGSRSKGLILWKHNAISNISEANGLTGNIVSDIFVDEDEGFWISTTSGLNRLIKLLENKFSIQKITEIHGLPTREVNSVTGLGDIIWVATNKGVATFNKRDIKTNKVAPNLYFDNILIGNKKVALKPHYSLPYDHHYIQLNFTGLSYRSQAKSLYRYRMLGVSDEWIMTNTRSVNYPSLVDGEYTFEVQVANEDGLWSTSKKIHFDIALPFWKTWWFVTLIVLLFISILILAFKLRETVVNKKEEQLRLLEEEKLMTVKSELKALRSQMNPHFTFNTLSAIRNAINTRDKSVASNYVVSFGKLIRMVLESSKNPTIEVGTEIEMLTLYLDLEALRFSDKFSYSVTRDQEIFDDSFYIPVMVVQPFVENAILHGLVPKEANNLELNISFTLNNETEMLCTIEDNGIGRAASEKLNKLKNLKKKSMGMEITQERLDLHYKATGKKHTFTVIDLIDNENKSIGTRVVITFPLCYEGYNNR